MTPKDKALKDLEWALNVGDDRFRISKDTYTLALLQQLNFHRMADANYLVFTDEDQLKFSVRISGE